jgi:hypothetical protein
MDVLISRSVSMLSNLVCVLLQVFMVTWRVFFRRVSHGVCHGSTNKGVVVRDLSATVQKATRNAAPPSALIPCPILAEHSSTTDPVLARAAFAPTIEAAKARANAERPSAAFDSEGGMGQRAPP